MTKTAVKLPTFEGKPLVRIPEIIPVANFLEGDFGRYFLHEYNGRVSEDYDNASALKVLNYENGQVKGSNPFAVVLANQILSQEGIRVATPADLEKVLESNALNLRGTYEDSALVIRSENDPNTYLARDLVNQLKARGTKIKDPVVIYLKDLNLRKDTDSPYGLSFDLAETAQPLSAPILARDGSFNSSDIDPETGLPTKLSKEGERRLYTRNSGLSWLCLGRDLNLYSDGEYLAYSDGGGRVVAVRGGAAGANFLDGYTAQVRKAYESRKRELDVKLEKALNLFK